MIQFNLLPDVKLQYVKAERTKRLILFTSIIVCACSITLLVLMLSAVGLQKKHLSDLSKDIKKDSATLQNKPNIGNILTVQNQLESITALHDGKIASSRLFGYLNNVTPANVAINNIAIDFTQNTITVTGSTDSLSSVNKYVDTLKLTSYSEDNGATLKPAFSNVVLSSFGVSGSTKDQSQAVSYTITLSFDPDIFNITKTISLTVPTITTRAQLQNPSDLFKSTSSGGKQ
jgi:Tfp pilus assembly protein PilN